jgi:hypothetical protein
MKHLKLFENFNNIESDIRSIFLDLEDSGFTIDIHNLEKVDQYIIGIKKLEESIYFPKVRPFEVNNDIIDCILRLKEFATIEGFEVNNISVNHTHYPTSQSENVNITDDGLFIKRPDYVGMKFDEVKVDYPIMWISIKLKKI